MGDYDHPMVKIVLPGLNVFEIRNEGDLQKALRSDLFKRNPDLFKSAVELNPLIVLLNRIVHCIARILKSQAHLKPIGKKRYRTVTQVKIHYAAAITSGVRANFTFASECVREALGLGHKIFADTLKYGGHDLIFDQLYEKALEKPDEIAVLINRVCNPPPVLDDEKGKEEKDDCTIPETKIVSDDGVDVGGNNLPDLKKGQEEQEDRAWFLTDELLLAGKPKPKNTRLGPKRVLTDKERLMVRKVKKETDAAVRAATLHCLKQCFDAMKKK